MIHSYTSGWKGATIIPDPPVPGIKEAIEIIRQLYNVVVVSSRCSSPEGVTAIMNYLKVNGIEQLVQKMAKDKNEFLYKTFKRHGYNASRVNSLAKAGRIRVVQSPNKETYFIDNKPIFTVATYVTTDEEKHTVKYTFVEEGFKHE